jgi:hypothetical protein
MRAASVVWLAGLLVLGVDGLAAGVTRVSDPTVDAPGSYYRLEGHLDASIRRYLARMNVPAGLADLALEEEYIATLANLYGLTSGEDEAVHDGRFSKVG